MEVLKTIGGLLAMVFGIILYFVMTALSFVIYFVFAMIGFAIIGWLWRLIF